MKMKKNKLYLHVNKQLELEHRYFKLDDITKYIVRTFGETKYWESYYRENLGNSTINISTYTSMKYKVLLEWLENIDSIELANLLKKEMSWHEIINWLE